MQMSSYANERCFLVPKTKQLSPRQFESLKAQLKLMTPSQLKSLQVEISGSLKTGTQSVLTHEELEVINSLF